MSGKSRVYLINAGPGSPDFITVKALRLIQQADVIVYDRLVPAELLALIPRGKARIIDGNKELSRQGTINELLLRLAAGRCVVYLKGGDPAIVGCGGEEVLFLAHHEIDCQVVRMADTLHSTTHAQAQATEITHGRFH